VNCDALTVEDLERPRGWKACSREAIEKAVKPAQIFDDSRRARGKRVGIMTSEYALCSIDELASPQARIPRGHGSVFEGPGDAIERWQHSTIVACRTVEQSRLHERHQTPDGWVTSRSDAPCS
jgi:hypothetical protein